MRKYKADLVYWCINKTKLYLNSYRHLTEKETNYWHVCDRAVERLQGYTRPDIPW